MRVMVSGWGNELPEATVQDVRDRIQHSLGIASDQINAIAVRLGEVERDDWTEARCRITVWLRQLRTVVAEAVDPDQDRAVERALRRARRLTWRYLHWPSPAHWTTIACPRRLLT